MMVRLDSPTAARALVLAVSVSLLAGAYGFQYIGGLVPCEMCWWQRYAHFVAAGLALAGFVLPAPRLWAGLGVVALASAALVGGFHAGVEYGWWKGFTECTSTLHFGGGRSALDVIMGAPVIRCDVVQWKLLGISMAGFDFLIAGGAALVAAALLATKERA
jgi:disulfide bond formation protein DsbB